MKVFPLVQKVSYLFTIFASFHPAMAFESKSASGSIEGKDCAVTCSLNMNPDSKFLTVTLHFQVEGERKYYLFMPSLPFKEGETATQENQITEPMTYKTTATYENSELKAYSRQIDLGSGDITAGVALIKISLSLKVDPLFQNPKSLDLVVKNREKGVFHWMGISQDREVDRAHCEF